MDAVIWFIGLALPVAMLIFLIGWMVGFNASCQITNWGTGYDDGWKAHKKFTEEIMGGKKNDNSPMDHRPV